MACRLLVAGRTTRGKVPAPQALHRPQVVGALEPRDLPEFKWINTVLGNLKTSLAGAFHSLNYRKYATAFLAAYAYRPNQSFDLRGVVAELVVDVAPCAPAGKSVIKIRADARF